MNKRLIRLLENVELGDALLWQPKKHNIITWLLDIFLKNVHVSAYSGRGEHIHFTWPECMETKIKPYLKTHRCIIMRFINITETGQFGIVQQAVKDKGKKYDVKSLFGYMGLEIGDDIGFDDLIEKLGIDYDNIENPINELDKWVCSSGYARWASKEGYYVKSEYQDERTTPDDILLSDNMEKIATI